MGSSFEKWVKWAALAFAVLCAAASLWLYGRCGAHALGALVVWAAAFSGILLPGLFLARLYIRPKKEAPAAAAAFVVLWGFGAFIAACLAASALRAPGLMRAWCVFWAGWAAVHAALPRSRPQVRRRLAAAGRFVVSGAGAALAACTGALLLLNALFAARYAHPSAVGQLVPSQDFFWNLGNTHSFANGLPLADLRVAGVTVTYHFLTELYAAGLWFASGLPAYDVAGFYAYGPVAAALVLCLYALGRQLWPRDAGRGRAVLLSAMPLWLCCASLWKSLGDGASRFGNAVALHTLSNINGQATAFLFLALLLLFLDRCLAPSGDMGDTASAILAFYGLAFAKGPQAGILAVALGCVVLLLAIQKRLALPAAVRLFALIPVGFAVLYRLYFAAGASSSMQFSLAGTVRLFYFGSILNALQIRFPQGWGAFLPLLMLAQSLLMAPAAFLAWVWNAVLALKKRLRVRPVQLVLHASALGGLLAFYLFDHYSSSQIYFASLAVFGMGIFLLESLPAVLKAGRRPLRRAVRAAALGLLAAGCLTAVCLYAAVGGTAAQKLAGEEDGPRCVLTADEERACAWLAQNLPQNALFATNRMHTGTALEGLSNVYTGLSGRGAYLESFKYAVSNMGTGAGDAGARYAEMEELFDAGTTPERVREICSAHNITLLICCPLLPGDEAHLASFPCVFESDGCRIYQVGP